MPAKTEKSKTPAPLVAVIMGSDSDLKELSPCMAALDSFGIPYKAHVASAHRSHDYLKKVVAEFIAGGGRVIIAAAGGAAHLPGVIASLTTLPVIGVPMSSKMLGLDSLLSIVQMPPGMPVATVGVGASKNAALLAAQILSLSDKKLKTAYGKFRAEQAEEVINKSEKLQKLGYKEYLDGK